MKWLDNTALVIVIIGAVNWLLVGIFQFDLVAVPCELPFQVFIFH